MRTSPRFERQLEIQNIQARQILVESLAIPSQVQPQQVRQQQPVGRLMADDQHSLSAIFLNDAVHFRACTTQHRQPGLAARGRVKNRIGRPGAIFDGNSRFDVLVFEPFPMPVIHFAKRLLRGGDDSMGLADRRRRRDRPLQIRTIGQVDPRRSQPFPEQFGLPSPFIGKLDIAGSGKTVLGAENRCPCRTRRSA